VIVVIIVSLYWAWQSSDPKLIFWSVGWHSQIVVEVKK